MRFKKLGNTPENKSGEAKALKNSSPLTDAKTKVAFTN